MSGTALVRSIREFGGQACPIVMMLSCSQQKDAAARFRQQGVAGCLIKPVRRAEMKAALLAALGVPSGEASPGEEAATGAAPASHPLRILLAEDNVVNQRVASALLERRGHTVTVAGNGREAVRLAGERDFDLVLMERCLEAGMDAYVSKPIKPELLFATIETVRSGAVRTAA